MPDLPLRPAGLQLGDDLPGYVVGPGFGRHEPFGSARVECGVDHLLDATRAEQGLGLLVPGSALFGEGAGLGFGVPGGEVCGLGEMDRLQRGGRPAVVGPELGGEVGGLGLDRGTPGRPGLAQLRVDAIDLPDRMLPAAGPGSHAHPEGFGEVGGQCGVVYLGGGDVGLVEHPSVHRTPLPVQGLYLVGDRHMGVQIGVAGARLAVGEGHRHQPLHIDLAHAVGAQSGEQDPLLDEGQGIADGGLVAALDQPGQLRIGQRPHRRD